MAKNLTVDIKAQNQELKRKLRESQAYIKELERTAKDSARGVSGSFDGAKSSVSRFTRECRDAGNSISSAFSNLKSGNLDGAVSSIRGISGAAAGAAAGVAAIGTVAVMAGSKIADLVGEGIELAQQAEGIKHRFEQIGGTSIYLESLRQHTHGLVNDLELMKATVKAKDFNIPMKDLGTYLEFAQLKSQQTGESVDYLVNSIVTGLGRQSVQILDNLGISAAELKQKMAEGKTMTEAVAEVINKQLSEAGEHFETTAEKAQRKLIELQNEEMRVGESLAPLKSEWSSFLTSVEIWAMKALQKVAALFSEAQRIQNLVSGIQQTSSGANAHIHKFNKIGTKESKQNYIRNYTDLQNKQINKISGDIYKLKQTENTYFGFHNKQWHAAIKKQIKDLEEKRAALRANRDEFLRYAQAQLKEENTIVTPNPEPNKTGGKSGRTSRTTPKESPIDKIIRKGTDSFETGLRKNALLGDEVKIPYTYVPTQTPEQIKEQVLGDKSTWTDELQGNIDKLFGEANKIQMRFDAGEMNADEAQAALDTISKMLKLDVPIQLDTSKIDKANQKFKDIGSTVDSVGKSFSTLGQAIESPELDVLGIIAQAVANIMLSYAQAAASPAVTSTGWGWIAFAAAGLTEALAAAASIKSATSGFANGGIIGGSMMHGDNMLARVNSGEMILNGNQQSNLFNMINNGNNGAFGGNVHFVLRGADLYGSMKNFSKTKSLVGKNTGIK